MSRDLCYYDRTLFVSMPPERDAKMNVLGNRAQPKRTRQKGINEDSTLNYEKAGMLSTAARWLLLGFILLFVVLVRVRLLDIPLERDEGEYAYMGQLVLQGVPPYSAAYSMKLPGTDLMYAGIMSLFGQSIRGIHLGLIVLNCATIVLLFYLGKKLANDVVGVIASSTYAVLSLSSSVFGFAAHATHFVALPAIGGALLLLSALDKNKPLLYFFSGTLFGLAFLMKQPGLFFIAFGATYLIYHYFASVPRRALKKMLLHIALFMSGALLPFLATVLWLYTSGVFDTFWFWTFQYAAQYGAQIPAFQILSNFEDELLSAVDGSFLLWIIAAAGLVVLYLQRDLKANRMFIILFSLFSFLSICPGFYFRGHYFIMLLPAVSLSAGILVHYLNAKAMAFFKSPHARFVSTGFFIAALLIGIGNQKDYLFKEGPAAISRRLYYYSPFPESVEIAKFIKANSTGADRIVVLGSEPQIYFYSRRRSATGHIYMYGLMEKHDYALSMQKEMIHEIESSGPKFIVLVSVDESWLVQPYSNRYILDWLKFYLNKNYRLVGAVDMISPGLTVYKWHDDAGAYVFQSPDRVLIFEKAQGTGKSTDPDRTRFF